MVLAWTLVRYERDFDPHWQTTRARPVF